MSAKGAHVQGASGSESTNSPVSSSPHSPIIDALSMYLFPNTIIILNIT